MIPFGHLEPIGSGFVADSTRTFVDRGGTFTDVVSVDSRGVARLKKIRSDRAVVGDLATGQLCFGTTVATNALLERTGVRTLLLVSRGFRDLLAIGDMTRPELFDADVRRPPTLATACLLYTSPSPRD